MTAQVYLSCSPADEDAAAWATAALEAAGHDVERSSDNTASAMSVVRAQEALDQGRIVIALLTDDFFLSSACMAEAFAALQYDAGDGVSRLVPARLTDCTPAGLLAGVSVVDLIDLSDEEKSAKLLASLETGGGRQRERRLARHRVQRAAARC